jgi:prophage DNA circulation protein
MTYREELHTASFRGVTFSVDGASDSYGRRGSDNEFPDSDTPYSDDRGARQVTFNVDGFVAGDDYLKRLDKIIAAASKEGPGVLIHPFYGRRVVMCRVLDVNQRTTRSGSAALSWTFREAGALVNPADAGSTQAAVVSGASTLSDAVEGDYGAVDAMVGSTYVAAQWLGDARDRVTIIIDAISGPFVATVSNIQEITTTLAGIEDDLEAGALIPSQLAARLNVAYAQIGSLAVVRALTGGSSNQAQTLVTSPVDEEETLQSALEANRALNQRYALARHAALVSALDLESHDQAIAECDAFSALTDAELAVPPTDDTFTALQDLASLLSRDMVARSQDLPRVVVLKTPVARPALVIAQELYGDPTREAEILTRNQVANPAYAAGDLLVLSR